MCVPNAGTDIVFTEWFAHIFYLKHLNYATSFSENVSRILVMLHLFLNKQHEIMSSRYL